MAKDIYHQNVREALEKEGWTITHDPYVFRVGKVDFRIDLGAERLLAAEKDGEKIAVEIKTFLEQSPVHAFHESTGQYDNYLLALEEKEPERHLFLAIPESIWKTFFQRPFIQKVISRKNIRLLIFSNSKNEIVQWIN